jgi:hypothetical protein
MYGRTGFSWVRIKKKGGRARQCCGSGMFIPDPTFFHPGFRILFSIPHPGFFFPSQIHIKELSILTKKKSFLSSRKYDPGCSFRIRILTFYPIRIPDPGRKKAPDPDPQHLYSKFSFIEAVTGLLITLVISRYYTNPRYKTAPVSVGPACRVRQVRAGAPPLDGSQEVVFLCRFSSSRRRPG